MIVTRICDLDGLPYTMDIPALTVELFDRGMKMRQQGALIQTAFWFLNADEREFLLTGITPDRWEKLFGPAGEEDAGE